jgi:hypothetical protein
VGGEQLKRKQRQRSQTAGSASEDLVWVPQADHPTTSSNKPPPKRQKSSPTNVTLKEVQDAYEKARRDGKLQSPFVPRSEEVSSSLCWNPYILPTRTISLALLDEEKLDDLRKKIKSITQRVPLATQWIPKTQEKALTPGHLRTIIRIACGSSTAEPRVLVDGKVSPILVIASSFLHHADRLEAGKMVQRGVAVARLIGYSIMRVYEAVEGEDGAKVSNICIIHASR